jgi:predicted Zn-dependent peptidase
MSLPLFSLDLRGALASSIQAHLFLVTKNPPLVLAAATSTTRKEEKQPEIQQMKQTAKAENQSNKALSGKCPPGSQKNSERRKQPRNKTHLADSSNRNQDLMGITLQTAEIRLEVPPERRRNSA